jgi:hypothetical protein
MDEKGPIGSKMNVPEDIAYQLLADWWMSTIQALVDSAGSQRAMDLLRPYYRNAAMAGAFILKDSLGLKNNDRITWLYVAKTGIDILTRGDHFEETIRENGSIARVKECPFNNGPVELCMMVCDVTAKTQAEMFAPDFDVTLESTLSQGDPECLWIVKPKSWQKPKDLADLGNTIAIVEPKPIPQEIVDDFSIQYLAEYWVISTRAFIDHIGNERPVSLMRPYMKHSGVSFGLRFKNSLQNENNEETIIAGLEYCDNMLHMDGIQMESIGKQQGKTIIDCPFKDAPTAVCMQFESFCNGICEAIDPDYEFAYDRMMTKGDKSCHWTIKKKGPSEELDNEERSKSSDETALELLKKRLVRGEITTDHYRQLREILSED